MSGRTIMTIDEAAETLGIELLPWQREVGQRILNGERVIMTGGKRAGRETLRRVIRGAQIDYAEIDRQRVCILQDGQWCEREHGHDGPHVLAPE